MSTDRVVLVTGGNRGIGRAIAERFVRDGYRVAVTARSGEGPEGTLTVRADVTDAAAVDAAFTEVEQKLGPVEVVVANAGITKDTLLMRMSEEEFTSVVDTNLTGAFRVVKRASKGMLKARFGRIVLISSVVGLFGGAGQVNYSTAKAGITGLTKTLAKEWGRYNVVVNCVCYGFIDTRLTASKESAETLVRDGQEIALGVPDAMRQMAPMLIPLGRPGTPEEAAGPIMFLCSPWANYVSGHVLEVTGGRAV